MLHCESVSVLAPVEAEAADWHRDEPAVLGGPSIENGSMDGTWMLPFSYGDPSKSGVENSVPLALREVGPLKCPVQSFGVEVVMCCSLW